MQRPTWAAGVVDQLPVLLACGLAAALCAPLFAPGLPVGWDAIYHLEKVDLLARELLPAGQTDGWLDRWHFGQRAFASVPPLFFLWAALLAWLPGVDTLTATRLVVFAAFVLRPLSVYVLARALWPGRLAAAGAALLVAGMAGSAGGGLDGTTFLGLYPNLLAFALLPLGLAALVHAARAPTHRRRALLALAAAAVILAHSFTGYAFVVAFAAVVVTQLCRGRRGRASAVSLLVAIGWAAAIAAFWLVPFLAQIDVIAAGSSWQRYDLFEVARRFWRAQLGVDRATTVLGLLGVAAAAWRRAPGDRLLLLASGALLLFLSGWLDPALPFRDLLASQRPRFVPLLELALVLAAGRAASVAGSMAIQLHGRLAVVVRSAMIAAAALILGLSSLPAMAGRARLWQTSRDYPAWPDLLDLVATARRTLPAGSRILAECSPALVPLLGTPHAINQAFSWLGGFELVSGGFPEGSPLAVALSRPARATPVKPARVLPLFRPLGLSHVVVASPASQANCARSPELRPVLVNGPLTVYQVVGTPRVFASQIPAEVIDRRAGRDFLHLRVSLAKSPARAVLPLAWDQGWSLEIDGRPAPLAGVEPGLVAFGLAGAGEHDIDLRWRLPPLPAGLPPWAGGVTSLLALLLAGIALREGKGGSTSGPFRKYGD